MPGGVMILYLDDYRKARLVQDDQEETGEGADTSAAAPACNVFQFRHPGAARPEAAKAETVWGGLEQDLDFVYALASQS